MLQRVWGGTGIGGGVVGGLVSYIGFVVVVYSPVYMGLVPGDGDLLGPVLSFLIAVCLGGLIGLVVGVLVWGVVSLQGPGGKT